MGFAWVTLATNDSYSLGALVLAHSLRNAGTSHQLAVLITPAVSANMRQQLSTVFDVVEVVDVLDSKDETNLALLKRPELGITFTKLHCWRLTQFEKCVFLDADTLVVRNSDELFEREELSAAPDVGWPDCFNSGVFVFRPSITTFTNLVNFAVEKGSFDGGDQGLLNLYFSTWATADISKHLPFIYNLTSVAVYSYIPAFKQYGADARIIHFIGPIKPWLQQYDPNTRTVNPTSDSSHLQSLLQQWWDIFVDKVHPSLSTNLECVNALIGPTEQAGSNERLVISIARCESPPTYLEPYFPYNIPDIDLPEPYTPYIEPDDERQKDRPYLPFDVHGTDGALLNLTFTDVAKEIEALNVEISNEEAPMPEPQATVQDEVHQESVEIPAPPPEASPPQPEQDPPHPDPGPFDYFHFFPDEKCIEQYLDYKTQQYQPDWCPEPFEEPPPLPRFLTIAEDDPRQGFVETSSNQHQNQQSSTDVSKTTEQTNYYPQVPAQTESHSYLPNNNVSHVPIMQNTQHETYTHSQPADYSKSTPSQVSTQTNSDRPIERSKSASNLMFDVSNPDTMSSGWTSQPEISVQPTKKLPPLKPLKPKFKPDPVVTATPHYTQYTELISTSNDPYAPVLDSKGFVERELEQKGMIALFTDHPVESPTKKHTPLSHQTSMNEFIELSECKRQAGNKQMPQENRLTIPKRKRIVRPVSKAAEKVGGSHDLGEILKRLASFTIQMPNLEITAPVTTAPEIPQKGFLKYKEFVTKRSEEGLNAIEDLWNTRPPVKIGRYEPEEMPNLAEHIFPKERRPKVKLTGMFGPVPPQKTPERGSSPVPNIVVSASTPESLSEHDKTIDFAATPHCQVLESSSKARDEISTTIHETLPHSEVTPQIQATAHEPITSEPLTKQNTLIESRRTPEYVHVNGSPDVRVTSLNVSESPKAFAILDVAPANDSESHFKTQVLVAGLTPECWFEIQNSSLNVGVTPINTSESPCEIQKDDITEFLVETKNSTSDHKFESKFEVLSNNQMPYESSLTETILRESPPQSQLMSEDTLELTITPTHTNNTSKLDVRVTPESLPDIQERLSNIGVTSTPVMQETSILIDPTIVIGVEVSNVSSDISLAEEAKEVSDETTLVENPTEIGDNLDVNSSLYQENDPKQQTSNLANDSTQTILTNDIPEESPTKIINRTYANVLAIAEPFLTPKTPTNSPIDQSKGNGKPIKKLVKKKPKSETTLSSPPVNSEKPRKKPIPAPKVAPKLPDNRFALLDEEKVSMDSRSPGLPLITKPKPKNNPKLTRTERVTSTSDTTNGSITSSGDTSGIAGAIAQLNLTGNTTAISEAQSEYIRRQGWETGNIDYMGRDSFSNIWSKISETLATKTVPEINLNANEDDDYIETLPSDTTTSPTENFPDDVIFDPQLRSNNQETFQELSAIVEETEDVLEVRDQSLFAHKLVENSEATENEEVIGNETDFDIEKSGGRGLRVTEGDEELFKNVLRTDLTEADHVKLDDSSKAELAVGPETVQHMIPSTLDDFQNDQNIIVTKGESLTEEPKTVQEPIPVNEIPSISKYSGISDTSENVGNIETNITGVGTEGISDSDLAAFEKPPTVPDITGSCEQTVNDHPEVEAVSDTNQTLDLSSDTESAFVPYKLPDENREKKSVFSKFLEFVGVKKSDVENSIFYDAEIEIETEIPITITPASPTPPISPPPVPEFVPKIVPEKIVLDKNYIAQTINELIERAVLIAEGQMSEDRIEPQTAVEMEEPIYSNIEEIKVTPIEDRLKPAGPSKLSEQILKAIPPPERKPFSNEAPPVPPRRRKPRIPEPPVPPPKRKLKK